MLWYISNLSESSKKTSIRGEKKGPGKGSPKARLSERSEGALREEEDLGAKTVFVLASLKEF